MNRTIPSCTAKNVYLETIANCYAVQYEMLCAFNFNVVSTHCKAPYISGLIYWPMHCATLWLLLHSFNT